MELSKVLLLPVLWWDVTDKIDWGTLQAKPKIRKYVSSVGKNMRKVITIKNDSNNYKIRHQYF